MSNKRSRSKIKRLIQFLNGEHTPHKFQDHHKASQVFLFRVIFASFGVFVLLVILVSKIVDLQIFNHDNYQTLSNGNRIKLIPIPPSRGVIYDRNGIPVAINETSYQLEADQTNIKAVKASFDKLRSLINLDDDDIANFYKELKTSPRFNTIPLKTNLTEQQIDHFIVNQYRFPFLEIKGYQKRFYPYGDTLTHVIGYVSKINENELKRLAANAQLADYSATHNIGKIGVERYYETLLHGKPGYEEVEVNNRGRFVRQLSEKPPVAGKDIYLTIDLHLQQYIKKLLHGRRAAVVVMDPNTGEVLAMVSSPSYDPNMFVNGISSQNYKNLLDNKDLPLINRTTQGAYPPGSTVKPFIASVALTENIIKPDTKLNAAAYWELPNTTKRYRDWRKIGHGKINVVQAIESSADTFFYQIAYDLGIDKLSRWMNEFGYGKLSGIDLNEEQSGNMPTRDWKLMRYKQPWYQGDTIPVGIGQGYWTATPIQQVKALTILLNDGKIRTPHLLLKTAHGTIEQPYQEKEHEQIKGISAADWDIAKLGMYRVIHGPKGTARNVFVHTKYDAAGKSGTSQVFSLKHDEIYREDQLPEHLRDHALFIAFAPYNKPKVAISIILENGGGGSSQGGSIAKKILDHIFLGDESITLPAAAKINLRGD